MPKKKKGCKSQFATHHQCVFTIGIIIFSHIIHAKAQVFIKPDRVFIAFAHLKPQQANIQTFGKFD